MYSRNLLRFPINDLRLQIKPILLLSASLTACFILPPLYVFAGWAIYALLGKEQAMQALSIACILKLVNSNFIPGLENNYYNWLVLIFSAVSLTIRLLLNKPISLPKSFLKFILPLYAVLFISATTSFYPILSLLKLLSFITFSLTTVTLLHNLRDRFTYWLSWFFSLYYSICFINVLLIGFSESYVIKGGNRLYQGFLNHPQAWIYTSPFIALLICILLLERTASTQIKSSFYFFILSGIFIGVFSVFLANTRTALIASSLGVLFSFFIYFRSKMFFSKKLITYSLALLLLLSLSSIGNLTGTVYEPVQRFVTKDLKTNQVEERSIEELLEGSRGYVVTRSLENFYKYPVFGIGFAVPSDFEEHDLEGDGGLKGSLPSAILEETGIVGATAFLIFLISSAKFFSKNSNPSIFAFYLSFFMVNLGEFNFFSFGGIGQYFWFIVGLCFASISVTKEPR